MPEPQQTEEREQTQDEPQKPPDHWFDKSWEPSFERWLKFFEFVVVAGTVAAVIAALAFEGIWILFGLPAPVTYTSAMNAQDRLQRVVVSLNANWKLGLMLLIPLFYRTIRAILERMEEGPLGTKFPKPKVPTVVTPES